MNPYLFTFLVFTIAFCLGYLWGYYNGRKDTLP
jgi:hypothetical protein